MFCPNCGESVPEGQKFCGNCGAAIDTGVPQPVVTAAPPAPPLRRRMKWWHWVIVLWIVVAGLACVIIYAVTTSSPEYKAGQTATAIAAATRVAGPTNTPEPTNTPQPTQTERPLDTEQPTNTPLPTLTPRPTNTEGPTVTPRPTNTPLPTLSEAERNATAMVPLISDKGNGFYLVGVDIAPGKWRSTGTGDGCYWARRDANQDTIDNHFGMAGGTVNIRPDDYEVEFNRCGVWVYVENEERVPREDATAPKGDGFYTVGIEIAPGKWRSNGSGSSCYWARLDQYQKTLDNHFGAAGGVVTIRDSDYEVSFNGCGEWEYLGP